MKWIIKSLFIIAQVLSSAANANFSTVVWTGGGPNAHYYGSLGDACGAWISNTNYVIVETREGVNGGTCFGELACQNGGPLFLRYVSKCENPLPLKLIGIFYTLVFYE